MCFEASGVWACAGAGTGSSTWAIADTDYYDHTYGTLLLYAFIGPCPNPVTRFSGLGRLRFPTDIYSGPGKGPSGYPVTKKIRKKMKKKARAHSYTSRM